LAIFKTYIFAIAARIGYANRPALLAKKKEFHIAMGISIRLILSYDNNYVLISYLFKLVKKWTCKWEFRGFQISVPWVCFSCNQALRRWFVSRNSNTFYYILKSPRSSPWIVGILQLLFQETVSAVVTLISSPCIA